MPSDDVFELRADPAVQRMLEALGCGTADELHLGGIAARDLAARFGTPLYVYDGDLLDARAALVQRVLGPRVSVLWSVKANPSLAITARLRVAGIGAEIASLGELELALAAGHDAASLRFAGPGKTDLDIEQALVRGLGCFHAESASEVDAIAAAARRLGRRAGIAVRVNPGRQQGGARLRMAGSSARFGVDEDQVPSLVRRIAGDRDLVLRGLHVYAGTQCFDAEGFAAPARALVGLAARCEREAGIALRELDLGGGFGVPVYAGDPEFDLATAAASVRALIAGHDREDRSWFVELGRYLVAPAGVYLTRIVRRKISGTRTQLALDGGLHHCAFAAGAGAVLRRPPLLVHATGLGARAAEPVAVGGPLCTPQDQLGDALLLPECREGDLLAVLGAGAYGLCYSPALFLSHPTPAEVIVQQQQVRLVRARGSATDVLRGQQLGG